MLDYWEYWWCDERREPSCLCVAFKWISGSVDELCTSLGYIGVDYECNVDSMKFSEKGTWASHDSTGSPVSPLSVCFRSCCLKSFEIRSFSLTCAAVSLCIIILSRANSRLKLCWETPVRDSDLVDSLSGQPQMHMSWCKFSHIRTDTSAGDVL